MSISGIQGQLLEVTVVGCNKLKDTEWISRQDPYVCLEYGSSKFRTRTCTDGGKNPNFQEKYVFTMIEGLRELSVAVWNSNTLSYDDFIGNGKIQLLKVLSQGYDDSTWPLQTKTGRYAGEIRVIMHYSNANHAVTVSTPSAPPYVASQVPLHSAPPPASAASYPPPASAASYPPSASLASYPPPASAASYPPPASAASYPPPVSTTSYSQPASVPYHPPATAYPSPSPYPSYAAYPPSPYPPQPVAYPPPPAPSVYPPPPAPSAYPPPSYPPSSPYYPPGHYPPGPYPPRPY
ncbi:hypothetical protein SLE2022_204480 [Rubroshorea leprosula]